MANLLDMCAIAVPARMRSDGLPCGVQLLAPAFADAALVRLGAACQPGAASLGLVDLDDDTTVTGFVCHPAAADPATDISLFGGRRDHPASMG
jgi:hypothetical protein